LAPVFFSFYNLFLYFLFFYAAGSISWTNTETDTEILHLLNKGEINLGQGSNAVEVAAFRGLCS
jgi:hypothetical protein